MANLLKSTNNSLIEETILISQTKPFLKPYDWLEEAAIYNKRYEQVPAAWFRENADVLVLLFTARGVDKDGMIQKFYTIYETIKIGNLPIEVIYVPMDDTEADMIECYQNQANWFALKFHDPLVHVLKFMYGITCIPHIYVLKIDGTIISTHGILDLVKYEKNAIMTWLSTSSTMKQHRKLVNETVYDTKWKYVVYDSNVDEKKDYHRKFSSEPESP
ncbi:uncharacterized protein LOC128679614 [Plodia interpunctella]|uniref:uncharacterized protein LOC128679614 n=1 Tax=Plodia interpunctella TaxID=58824 RepID=UPI0023684064|nr:uncharacterized protein LOC128679614 [Plodia interpunctella]